MRQISVTCLFIGTSVKTEIGLDVLTDDQSGACVGDGLATAAADGGRGAVLHAAIAIRKDRDEEL